MKSSDMEKYLDELDNCSELRKASRSHDLNTVDISAVHLGPFEHINLKIGKNAVEIYNFVESSQVIDEDVYIPQGQNMAFFIPPKSEPHVHKHSFIEMVYVYSGSCIQTINGQEIIMNQGDLCILDTNTYHSIQCVRKDDLIINCLMRTIYFDSAFMSRLSGNDLLSSFFAHAIYLSKESNRYILFKASEESEIQIIFLKMLCEYHDKEACYSEMINSYMTILFSELVRIYKKDLNMENFKSLGSTKISDIIQYIQQNCRALTLTSTAEYFHFHPIYLCKIIKKYANCSFTDLKNEARLNIACTLLKNTSSTIHSITDEIGYSNIHFFYNLFKKKYGVTPAEYRKSYKQA